MPQTKRVEAAKSEGDVLLACKDELIRRWEKSIIEDPDVPEADRTSRPYLRDHMPEFIERLACALDDLDEGQRRSSEQRISIDGCALEHARDRVHRQYGLDSALREWAHMHATILDTFAESGRRLTVSTAKIIGVAIHEAMSRVALEMHAAALEDSKLAAAELEAVIESAPEAILIGTKNGITSANRLARSLLGHPDLAHLNKNIDALVEQLAIRDPVTKEPVPPEEVAYRQALNGQRVVKEILVRQPKTKKDIIVRTAASPVVLDGKVLGAVSIHTDVTEEKKYQARLAEEACFRERFMGILGHDLREPLSGIMMALSTLISFGDAPPAHERLVQRSMRSAKRMLGMIEALLDLTRTRLGSGLDLEREDIDLAPLCRNVIEELEGSHLGRKIHLAVHGDLRGSWDPGRLAQAISNLASNALEHGPPDEPIEMVLTGKGDTVVICVSNRGPSIPADVQETIFEPFKRTKSQGARGGHLGLGLYIVHEIVRAHEGNVAVRSSDGVTTFTVELPRFTRTDEARKVGP